MNRLVVMLFAAALLSGCASSRSTSARYPVRVIDPVTEEAPDVIKP